MSTRCSSFYGATTLFALLAATAPLPVEGAGCTAASGARTTALVELYTSEGCSSCPPADRWLSKTFAGNAESANAIALSFHVDYWDRLGWKDRFATAQYTQRQYDAMRTNHARFVYTPQVLIQGQDFAQWQRGAPASSAAIAAANAKPARATITLTAEPQRGTVAVKARVDVANSTDRKNATLYLALVDSGLASDVKAGENSGVRLTHDHVVRSLRGGPPVDANGVIVTDVAMPLSAEIGIAPAVVAFVQNKETGDILQALELPLTGAACTMMR